MSERSRYPPIADYAVIGDCHTIGLVSRAGSIDWCCMPRFEDGSCFGRLLDWERGGHFSVGLPDGAPSASREYEARTLVLATTFRSGGGQARVLDCMLVPPAEEQGNERRLLRVIEGERGALELVVRFAPRFDYGDVSPWIRNHGRGVFSATGGDEAFVVWSDAELSPDEDAGALDGRVEVRQGQRVRLLASFVPPEGADEAAQGQPDPADLDKELDKTIRWWRRWASTLRAEGPHSDGAVHSALVLKALSYEPSGAMVAAATTSLPESAAGTRTWDYRYSWIRDSSLAARSLAELGCEAEAEAFRRFIERTAAGDPAELRIVYGPGGERRIGERQVERLDGWRGAGPVRIGNDAVEQSQLDALGQLLDQSWRWHRRGHQPDDDYWRFLVALVETAVERWGEPDAGIWEWPGEPRHFVHSKAHCWRALDCGLTLAEECMRKAPESRWRRTREEIREAIESEGYDEQRGVFVQAFGHDDMDAAILRLPIIHFLDWRDERMLRTTDAIREELGTGDGLVRRYKNDDGLEGEEGAFVACSFWLVEALSRQDRRELAQEAFDRTVATANDLGLFSEEYDPAGDQMLGNFPQALTHLSHIEAIMALREQQGPEEDGV
ncbi:MAG: glycoside hydrolase family 15 protein [Thermoleophilaceae bacterium]